RFNFVIFEKEIADNPMIAEAFSKALKEWVSNLPVECIIFQEKENSFPFISFGSAAISSQQGIIKVHIIDVHAEPYNLPPPVLGFWSWEDNILALDKNALSIDPDRAYAVCMHELGHIFGLEHFVNTHNLEAQSGYIVVSDNFPASKLVMYPLSSEDNIHAKLSNLEIELAKKNLLNLKQLAHNNCFQLTSQ